MSRLLIIFSALLVLSTLAAGNMFPSEKNTVFSILPGLDVVKNDLGKRESRFLESDVENNNVVYRAMNFLDGHEVKLKLNNLLNSSDVENVYSKVIESFEAENGKTAGKSA